MIQSVRGFKDIFGKDALYWQILEDIIRDSFRKWGFEEVRTPMLEKTELFERGIGDDTDIVEKEMYTFTDKGGERVTLRPEGTASVIRLFNEHKLYGTDRYFKFFYLGPMFRYERPQKGRLRQFHQAGVELLGDPSPRAELEVITLLVFIVERLGIKNTELKINSLGCSECRKAFRESLISYYNNKEESLCTDCKRRLKTNPLRLIDCKSEGCRELGKDAPKITSYLCDDCKNHFISLKGLLNEQNIPFTEAPDIVRGLDYYNRTVFELHSSDLGAQSALLAGGRYDSLSSDLGGVSIPAVGWAMGMERIVSVLNGEGLFREDKSVFVAFLGENAERETLVLVNELRKAGIKAEFDILKGSLKSQFRRADKVGARWVIVIGENEIKTGLYQIKDMAKGEQRPLPKSEIINFLRQL